MTDTKAAPGWYPDPGGLHDQRYGDGDSWTDGVNDDGVVTESSLPPIEEARPPAGVVPVDARADLPSRALWWALAGLVAAVIFSACGALLGWAVAPPTRAGRLAVGGRKSVV